MKINNQEPFEKPDGGSYIGTIIDIVEKPNQPVINFATRQPELNPDGTPKFQDQITIVWVMNYLNGQPAVDSKGRMYQVFETYNAYISPTSKFMKGLTQILNAAPPAINDTAQLEGLLLNRSSQLFITKTPKQANPNDSTVKVLGHSPLQPGMIAPKAPADFIRAKNRTKNQAGPQPGQTTQTFAQRPAQTPQAPAPVNLNNQNEAF